MNVIESNREVIEKQFQELVDKAKEVNPNIEDAIFTMSNITAKTTSLQDYLNLTVQTPIEISNNQISI